MELTAGEMQLLAALDQAGLEERPSDRASLEDSAKWFWIFLEDWPATIASLRTKGLITGDETGLHLSQSAAPLAKAYNRERPDLYYHFYRKLYPAAFGSAAHSRLCERVFGQDLCQDGQVDMAALQDLLGRLDLTADDHLLDLGCGAGVIAGHIAAETGARVTSLDYAATAIAAAKARTAENQNPCSFLRGDINALSFPPETFDAVISLDTLYWVTDLTDALSRIVGIVKPGGRLGIFMEQGCEDGTAPDRLEAGNTDLSRALKSLGLAHEIVDYSAQNAIFWRAIKDAAADLRRDFEAEGNGFIAWTLSKQAEEFLPEIEAGRITRYLYHIRL